MDQDVVKTILNEIVQSVVLLENSSDTSSIIKKNLLVKDEENIESNNIVVPEFSQEIDTFSTNSTTKTVINKLEQIEDSQETISQKSFSERTSDPTEIIEPYLSECSDTDKIFNETKYLGKSFSKTGINKGKKPYTPANNEPSVIVINNYSDESGTSDSDYNDTEKSVHKSDKSVIERRRKISKQNSIRNSCKKKSSINRGASVRVINDGLANNSALSDSTDLSDTDTSSYRPRVRISDNNSSIEPYEVDSSAIIKTQENKSRKEQIHIEKFNRSPRIYGRKVRQLQEDIDGPSTSTNFVPSVIVINDLSNGSSTSSHSTGEMQRRTERNFAFLSDSDFSDTETEQNLGYRNRAYEPSVEIELENQEAEINIQSERNVIVPELRTISFDDSYIWSTTGLSKVAQLICCITMYISIGLCRFYSRYIQVYCIIGAIISIFLLIVYSYRIQLVHWKSYKIRLLLSEFIYLVIYTACDTVFAIIKFEFNEEANYRERMATMILMTSTGLAAAIYCCDAIASYSFMKEAEKNNPEEKRLIRSYLPTCSQQSRDEICDIFHTCIL